MFQQCNVSYSDVGVKMHGRARRATAIEKLNELQRIVENWDSNDIGQCCTEYIRGNY